MIEKNAFLKSYIKNIKDSKKIIMNSYRKDPKNINTILYLFDFAMDQSHTVYLKSSMLDQLQIISSTLDSINNEMMGKYGESIYSNCKNQETDGIVEITRKINMIDGYSDSHRASLRRRSNTVLFREIEEIIFS